MCWTARRCAIAGRGQSAKVPSTHLAHNSAHSMAIILLASLVLACHLLVIGAVGQPASPMSSMLHTAGAATALTRAQLMEISIISNGKKAEHLLREAEALAQEEAEKIRKLCLRTAALGRCGCDAYLEFSIPQAHMQRAVLRDLLTKHFAARFADLSWEFMEEERWARISEKVWKKDKFHVRMHWDTAGGKMAGTL